MIVRSTNRPIRSGPTFKRIKWSWSSLVRNINFCQFWFELVQILTKYLVRSILQFLKFSWFRSRTDRLWSVNHRIVHSTILRRPSQQIEARTGSRIRGPDFENEIVSFDQTRPELRKLKFLQSTCNSVEHIRIPNNWQEYDVLEHEI